MAQEFAKPFYHSQAWKKCRKAFIAQRIAEDGGLCSICHDYSGYIVHHKILLTPSNIDDPNITLNPENLDYLCHRCHDAIHTKEKFHLDYVFVDGQPSPILK